MYRWNRHSGRERPEAPFTTSPWWCDAQTVVEPTECSRKRHPPNIYWNGQTNNLHTCSADFSKILLLLLLLETEDRFARHQPFLLVDNRTYLHVFPGPGENRMHRDTIRNLIALRLLSLSRCTGAVNLGNVSRFSPLARLVSRIRDRFPASWHLILWLIRENDVASFHDEYQTSNRLYSREHNSYLYLCSAI